MTAARVPGAVLWVCVDCYWTHNYGEPDWECDRKPLALLAGEDLTAGLTREEHAPDCPAFDSDGDYTGAECDCEHDSFSWRECPGCGSILAGDRYALTVWERVENETAGGAA